MMDESRTSEEGQRELNCLKRRKCRSNPNWTIKEIKVLLKACRDVYNNDKMAAKKGPAIGETAKKLDKEGSFHRSSEACLRKQETLLALYKTTRQKLDSFLPPSKDEQDDEEYQEKMRMYKLGRKRIMVECMRNEKCKSRGIDVIELYGLCHEAFGNRDNLFSKTRKNTLRDTPVKEEANTPSSNENGLSTKAPSSPSSSFNSIPSSSPKSNGRPLVKRRKLSDEDITSEDLERVHDILYRIKELSELSKPPSHKRPFREYVNEDAFWNEVVVAGADKAEMNAFRRKWTLQKLQTVLRALGKGAREVLLEDGDIMLYCSLLGALGVSESDL